MFNYIEKTLQPYLTYFPYFLIAFVSSFILTPIVGYLARKLKIVDLPATLRKPTDTTKKTRITKNVVPRGGGLAVVIPTLIFLIISVGIDKQIVVIILGILVLAIGGILDDRYGLKSKHQIFFQILASLIVVSGGISIDSIQSPFDTSINLRSLVLPFSIGSSIYSIALPADLITIIWILIMINAINWIFGIDGLGEGVSFISFLSILLVSVKSDNNITALISVFLAGGILGFIPFNISPAKIFSGTTGDIVYGFLIAVLSILGGVKVSTSVIVLMIPILDMIWVMIGRINKEGLRSIFDIFHVTTIGDDTHLHHRLIKLGLSIAQVTLVEWMAVFVCALIAFITADLPKVTIITIICIIVLMSFIFISILLKRGVNLKKKNLLRRETAKKKTSGETPESRYAY